MVLPTRWLLGQEHSPAVAGSSKSVVTSPDLCKHLTCATCWPVACPRTGCQDRHSIQWVLADWPTQIVGLCTSFDMKGVTISLHWLFAHGHHSGVAHGLTCDVVSLTHILLTCANMKATALPPYWLLRHARLAAMMTSKMRF